MLFALLADAVLLLHVLFVLFVVLGLVLLWVGHLCGWRWVHSRWFCVAHLAAIGVVTLQAWLGVLCPLTVLEGYLRSQAGESFYSGSFVGHWLQRLIYYEAPAWVFTAVYTVFLALVAGSYGWIRRRRP